MTIDTSKFLFIAGPCAIEDQAVTLDIAAYLKDIAAAYPVTFVFKASFDKANRTSIQSPRGPGIVRGIKILEQIKKKLNVLIVSDVHCCDQIKQVKDVLDIIQIPAFLCRQTDLLIAAAQTKKMINVKKGQFLAPSDMAYIVKKIETTGNRNILLTERGSCFGYNNLVVDFRSFMIMRELGYPVIFDVTHSLQRPSANKGISGGDTAFVLPLSMAAAACGIDGLFMEVHPRPKQALSDKHTSYPLNKVKDVLSKILKIQTVLLPK